MAIATRIESILSLTADLDQAISEVQDEAIEAHELLNWVDQLLSARSALVRAAAYGRTLQKARGGA